MVVTGSCGNCSDSWCNFFSDYLFYVYVPKYVTIYNRRLGVLFRSMQALAIVWVGITLSSEKPWFDDFPVHAYGHHIWTEDGQDKEDVDRCEKLSFNDYDFGGDRSLKPSHCSRPPRGERTHVNSNGVFLHTIVFDNFTLNSDGQSCHSSACSAAGEDLNATCRCQQYDTFLVKDVDEDLVFVHHGYAVNSEDVIRHASSMNHRIRVTSSSDKIRTRIRKFNNEDCFIGGKKEWTNEDARNGIKGTVSEWLACGGFYLDGKMRNLEANSMYHKPGMQDVRLRAAGADVNLHFYYEGELGSFEALWTSDDLHGDSPSGQWNVEVTCTVKVEVVPKWKAWESFSFLEPPTPGLDVTANRFRRSYGVAFQTITHGHIRRLSKTKILTAIVNAIVMIVFPARVLYWIVLYGVGLLSEIYYKAANEDLNVHKDVSGVGVRMLNAMCAFKSLNSKGQKWSDQTRPLPVAEVFEGMCLVLKKHMEDGVLDDLEVAQLVACMMDSLDMDMHDRAVTMGEFVQAATSNEILNLGHVAQLFDYHRKRGIMERIFDDTPKHIHARRKEVRQTAAPEVMKILKGSSVLTTEETQIPDSSPRETQEPFLQPNVLTQIIKTAVAEALGDLPARLEQLEMETTVWRNSVNNSEMLEDGVPLKEELGNRVARLESNRLEEGLLQNIEDLEARVSRLEAARLEEAWSLVARLEDSFRLRAAQNMSNSSLGVVANPTAQLGTNSSQSRPQGRGSQEVKFVVQEEMQPRSSPPCISIRAIETNHDIPVPLATPSSTSGTTPATTRTKDDRLQHQESSRERTLGNQSPIISANMGPNVMPSPRPTFSGHQRILHGV